MAGDDEYDRGMNLQVMVRQRMNCSGDLNLKFLKYAMIGGRFGNKKIVRN